MTAVGFDLDGTLFSQGKMLEVVNRELGANLSHDDWKDYNLSDVYHVPDSRINEIFKLYGSEIYHDNKPQPAVEQVLRDYDAKGNDIILITARPAEENQATEYALHKYKIPYDAIVYASAPQKAQVINELSVANYYDDYGELLDTMTDKGQLDHAVDLHLVDAPYNKWCNRYDRLLLS